MQVFEEACNPRPEAPEQHGLYMALSDFSDDSGGEYLTVVIGTTKPAEHTGYMGYKTPSRGGGQASETSNNFSVISAPDSRKSNVRKTRTIGSAMSDALPEGSNTKFTFGQHEGLTYHEVMHKYPCYYLWGKGQKSPSRLLANFLDWATENYEVDQETNEVLPRMEPAGDVPRMPTRNVKKGPSGRRMPPNPPKWRNAKHWVMLTFDL